MRFSSLSSGSAGNSTFIQSGDTRILIDCGISVRLLASRLREIGESIDGLSGIVCSHIHGDHVNGIARTVRERIRRGNALSTYLTRPTAELMDWEGLERPPVKYFESGKKFEIGDLEIQSFSVSHDAPDPVAFTVTDRAGIKAVVAVDMGGIPDSMNWYAKGAQIVLIESNHDGDLLRNGSYPAHLKARICGETGHLSNAGCRNFIRRNLDASVRHLILGHLSRQNNTPSLALDGALECVVSKGLTCTVEVATYKEATRILEII